MIKMITASNIYVHYGSDEFVKSKFLPVKNYRSVVFKKPTPGTGFWASPKNSEHSWKKWCEQEGFGLDKLKNSFEFFLKENSKILLLKTLKDYEKMLEIYSKKIECVPCILGETRIIDFEKMQKDGIDAVLYFVKDLYFEMYGWDCDSILVLNPEIIIPVK